MIDHPLANLRETAEQFQRLADLTHDPQMALQLQKWAAEIQSDIRRFQREDRLRPLP